MTEEEKIKKANAFKEEGNFYLNNHLYGSATEKYTQAINLYPTAVFYANRAQASIKLEQYGSAIEDANAAITYVFIFFGKIFDMI
jgi:serine/threonine-protein phosphatase 5